MTGCPVYLPQVFPDLRAWCENRRLHLVDCDLRWVSLLPSINKSQVRFSDKRTKQECIPVGCVPPAAVAVCWRGVCLSACWNTHTHPGVGLETLETPSPSQTPQPPSWVLAWRPPRPDLSTSTPGCGAGDLQGMLGYQPPPPPDRILDKRF